MNSNTDSNGNENETSNNIHTPTPQPKQVRPRTTRVKPGRLNTDAINPKLVNTVAEWVSYYERTNVRLGPEGSLQVLDSEGAVKTIPFQKGFDAIRGVTMRSELLRKKSADYLANLRQARQRELQELQDSFVMKEKELLEATQHYRETNPRDEEVANQVVVLNQQLTAIHEEIHRVKYALQERVVLEPYQRAVIQFGTHDESVIMINQSMNMETTAPMRTLGVNGEELPRIESTAEEMDENGTDSNESTATDSTDIGNESSIGGNETNTGSTGSTGTESNEETTSTNVTNSNDVYFDELVDELKTKLKTFQVPEGMTVGQLKSAIFTEERLVYYRTHMVDFNKQFREAYLKAITGAGTA